MTREKLVKILTNCEKDQLGKCADIILAALDKEREGEHLLADCREEHENLKDLIQAAYDWSDDDNEILKKSGSLIFRPTNQEDKK